MSKKQDNWQHRSAGMTCVSCMWFVPKVAADRKPRALGRCRRRAPELGGFPAVFNSDWCGDHKLDENALPPA